MPRPHPVARYGCPHADDNALADNTPLQHDYAATDQAVHPRRAWRQEHAKPAAQHFFAWIEAQFAAQGLLPSSKFTKALAYARERREGLLLYLGDPDVDIDTNSLERALRAIPMGRKNWNFCWTEVGARQVGVAQSLLGPLRSPLHQIVK